MTGPPAHGRPPRSGEQRWWAAHAWLPTGPAGDVTLTIADGRFVAVTSGTEPGDARRLPGIVLPGFANVHSHAFHRALRGRTHDRGGTFWTWRDRMYAVAACLDPDSYLALARATYAEMALAGVSAVGEFHYLHHGPGGRRYADPNAMAVALAQAASDAGIRLTLLDTCYLAGGLDRDGHLRLDPVQQRFADVDVDAWAARVAALPGAVGPPAEALGGGTPVGEAWIGEAGTGPTGRGVANTVPGAGTGGSARIGEAGSGPPAGGMSVRVRVEVRIGVAVHSVRAVPRPALPTVARVAAGRPLHVHLSEQPAENAACHAHYGRTPTELLDDAGLLSPSTTAVHATHLTPSDIATLGRTGAAVCLCPTTERDLADGIGPARELHDAGTPLALGSDQHAVVDLLEEARALEMHERLRSGRRARFTPAELLAALTAHDTLGHPGPGQLAAGAPADLVAVRTDTIRTAGGVPEQIVLTATAADVDTVLVGGSVIVDGGRHRLGDVAALLRDAIEPLWRSA